jgi:hypothetical protein
MMRGGSAVLRRCPGRVNSGSYDPSRRCRTDPSFDALCTEYCKVIELLDGFETQIKRLSERRVWLEEELLTRIEGYQPH